MRLDLSKFGLRAAEFARFQRANGDAAFDSVHSPNGEESANREKSGVAAALCHRTPNGIWSNYIVPAKSLLKNSDHLSYGGADAHTAPHAF